MRALPSTVYMQCCDHAVGRVHAGEDVVVFLSHSGQTEECITPAEHLKNKGASCLCIVSQPGEDVTVRMSLK